MKFETFLNALMQASENYGSAVDEIMSESLDGDEEELIWLENYKNHSLRQRDAFRARLIAIYQQQEELKGDIKHWQQMYNVCDDLFWEQLRKLCEILDVPYRKTSFEKALALVQERLTKYQEDIAALRSALDSR